MANNALRNYCEEGRLGKQGKRPLQIAAWFPTEGVQKKALSGPEDAMQTRYLSYANGWERISIESMHLDWVSRALDLGPDRFDVDHLAEIVAATNQALREGRYNALGEAIAELPFDRLSPHVIAAVLRVMSPAKQLIQDWNKIIREATVNLLLRGLDAQRLLRGLY